MTDGTGTTSYSYGTIGTVGGNLLKTVVSPVGGSTATISYTYDPDGRLGMRSIGGLSESYNYSNLELTNVTNSLGGFNYTYDPNSARLVNVAYPNGQSVTMDYFTPTNPLGASGSLKDITNLGGGSTGGQILSKFSYTYTSVGDIYNWVQQLGNSTTLINNYNMSYDADSELTGVTLVSGSNNTMDSLTAGQAVTYTYDSAGNRTSEGAPTYLNSFNANNLNQLTSITPKPIPIKGATNRAASVTVNGSAVTQDSNFNYNATITPALGASTPLTVTEVASDGSVNYIKNHVLNTLPYKYDKNGNMLTDGVKNYLWDAANRLISISYLNPQPNNFADNIVMSYDGFGRRTAITERHGSAILTAKTFIWSIGKLCQERDGSGLTVTKQFFPQGERIGSSNYYFAFDHLGSVREMVDSSGVSVRASYNYDAWGRQVKIMGDLDSDFGYSDFYVNRTSGLDLTWYRAYDPDKGRWLNRDPLDDVLSPALKFIGPNLYKYVMNNPVNMVDPDGRLAAPALMILAMALLCVLLYILTDASHACIDLKEKYKSAFETYERARDNQLYDIAGDAIRIMSTIANSYYAQGCVCQYGQLASFPPPPNLSGTPGN